jgi:hypothetical protein
MVSRSPKNLTIFRSSWESRTSGGGRRSRRSVRTKWRLFIYLFNIKMAFYAYLYNMNPNFFLQSSDSLKNWNQKLKVTSQHPFKLRTEVIMI